jgi:hypothetical protein
MKARTWWTLRHLWHWPHQYHQSAKLGWFFKADKEGIRLNPFYLLYIDRYRRASTADERRAAVRSLLRTSKRHCKVMAYRALMALWYRSGVCCAGGSPQVVTKHLRTDICDWLERQARAAEERESGSEM